MGTGSYAGLRAAAEAAYDPATVEAIDRVLRDTADAMDRVLAEPIDPAIDLPDEVTGG